MAYAKMVLSDGSVIQVGTKADGPDALDECVRRIKELYATVVVEDDQP